MVEAESLLLCVYDTLVMTAAMTPALYIICPYVSWLNPTNMCRYRVNVLFSSRIQLNRTSTMMVVIIVIIAICIIVIISHIYDSVECTLVVLVVVKCLLVTRKALLEERPQPVVDCSTLALRITTGVPPATRNRPFLPRYRSRINNQHGDGCCGCAGCCVDGRACT